MRGGGDGPPTHLGGGDEKFFVVHGWALVYFSSKNLSNACLRFVCLGFIESMAIRAAPHVPSDLVGRARDTPPAPILIYCLLLFDVLWLVRFVHIFIIFHDAFDLFIVVFVFLRKRNFTTSARFGGLNLFCFVIVVLF